MTERFDRLAGPQTVGGFIDLYHRGLAIETDDLAGQAELADPDLFAVRHAGEPGDDERAVDLDDRSHRSIRNCVLAREQVLGDGFR